MGQVQLPDNLIFQFSFRRGKKVLEDTAGSDESLADPSVDLGHLFLVTLLLNNCIIH